MGAQMASKLSGLRKHHKSGRYFYLRVIPPRLQSFFPERRGKWREALNTSDYATAKLLALKIAMAVESLFQQAELRLKDTAAEPEASISLSTLVRIVAAWKQTELKRRAELVTVGSVMPEWSRFLSECETLGFGNVRVHPDDPEEWLAQQEREQSAIDEVVREITQTFGILISPTSPQFASLGAFVRKAWLEMLEVEHRWRLLDHDDLEEFITQPDIDVSIINAETTGDNKKPTIIDDGVPKLSQALAVWNAQMKPESQTLIETETAMRRFIDIFGDMKISDVHKEHTRKYRDMLSKVPKHLTAKQRMLPINVLMDLDQSHPRPAPQTINKSLNLLGAVLSRAEKEGHFDNINWSNPFAVKLPVDERDEESYEPFSVDELNALLSSPVFSKKIRPTSGKLDTAKWVPLFALFHGARRAEVLQLFVSDVQYIENTGVWTFDINRKYGKKVKNATSERIVPIHPKIIELGFPIFYRERLKAVGVEGALWQGFEDREKYKSRSDNWSKWFHSYLDAYVTTSKVKRFHSFRATFKRFGRDATSEMSDVIIDRICGHSPRTEGEKYGRQKDGTGRRDGGYTIERLAIEIAKLKFDGVDFSKIR